MSVNAETLIQFISDLRDSECQDCDASTALLSQIDALRKRRKRILKELRSEIKYAETNTLRNQTVSGKR